MLEERRLGYLRVILSSLNTQVCDAAGGIVLWSIMESLQFFGLDKKIVEISERDFGIFVDILNPRVVDRTDKVTGRNSYAERYRDAGESLWQSQVNRSGV